MELSKKVKVPLDETRMLILGTQICSGFSSGEYSVTATISFRQTRVIGETAGAAAGIVAAGAAIGLWYGFPRVRRLHVGHRERAMKRGQSQDRSNTPLHAKIEQMLTEARVVLPGAQALFGFQLAIVLTQSFEQLPTASMINACNKPLPRSFRCGAADGSGCIP